jgi:hypothetical protein
LNDLGNCEYFKFVFERNYLPVWVFLTIFSDI